MAPVLVGNHASSSPGTATASQAWGSSVTKGNLLVVVFVSAQSVTLGAISDTVGSTWNTTFVQSSGGGNRTGTIGVCWAMAGGTGANTVRLTVPGSSGYDLTVCEFSGVSGAVQDGAALIDGAAQTTVITPSVTTTAAGDLILNVVNTGSSGTPQSPWTQIEAPNGDPVSYQVAGASGTYAPNVTMASATWISATIALNIIAPPAIPTRRGLPPSLGPASVQKSGMPFGAIHPPPANPSGPEQIVRVAGFPVEQYNSATVTAPSGAQVGDLLVIGAALDTGKTVTGVSGGGVTTWQQAHAVDGGTGTWNQSIWWGTVTTSGGGVVTVSYSSAPTTKEIVVDCLRLLNGIANWGAASSADGGLLSTQTTVTYPSLTAGDSLSAYVGFAVIGSDGVPGSTAGFVYNDFSSLASMEALNTGLVNANNYSATGTCASTTVLAAGVIFSALGGTSITVVAVTANAVASVTVPVLTVEAPVAGVTAAATATVTIPSTNNARAPPDADVLASASVPAVSIALTAVTANALASVPLPALGENLNLNPLAATALASAPVPALRLDESPVPVTANALASVTVPVISLPSATPTANVAATAPVPALRLDEAPTPVTANALASVTTPVISLPSAVVTANALASVTAPVVKVSLTAVTANALASVPLPALGENLNLNPLAATALASAPVPALRLDESPVPVTANALASVTVPVISLPSATPTATALASAAVPTLHIDTNPAAVTANALASVTTPVISLPSATPTATALASAPVPALRLDESPVPVTANALASVTVPVISLPSATPTANALASVTAPVVKIGLAIPTANALASAPVPALRLDETIAAVSAGAVAAASSLSSFPATSTLDNFTRANENPVSDGGKWSGPIWVGDDVGKLSSNALVAVSNYGESLWADTFGGAVDVAITVGASVAGWPVVYSCITNPSPGSFSGYELFWNAGASALVLQSVTAQAETNLWNSGAGVTMVPGDSFGLRVSAGTLTMYYKSGSGAWQVIGTYTDGTYTSGRIGCGWYHPSSGGTITNFGGGSATIEAVISLSSTAVTANALASVTAPGLSLPGVAVTANALASAPAPVIKIAATAVTANALASVPLPALGENLNLNPLAATALASAPVPALRLDEGITAVSAGAVAAIASPIVQIAVTTSASALANVSVPGVRVDGSIAAVTANAVASAAAPTVVLLNSVFITAVTANVVASAHVPLVVLITPIAQYIVVSAGSQWQVVLGVSTGPLHDTYAEYELAAQAAQALNAEISADAPTTTLWYIVRSEV